MATFPRYWPVAHVKKIIAQGRRCTLQVKCSLIRAELSVLYRALSSVHSGVLSGVLSCARSSVLTGILTYSISARFRKAINERSHETIDIFTDIFRTGAGKGGGAQPTSMAFGRLFFIFLDEKGQKFRIYPPKVITRIFHLLTSLYSLGRCDKVAILMYTTFFAKQNKKLTISNSFYILLCRVAKCHGYYGYVCVKLLPIKN